MENGSEYRALIAAMELLRNAIQTSAAAAVGNAANVQRVPRGDGTGGRGARTPGEDALRAFLNDPDRRDAKARKTLAGAQEKDDRDRAAQGLGKKLGGLVGGDVGDKLGDKAGDAIAAKMADPGSKSGGAGSKMGGAVGNAIGTAMGGPVGGMVGGMLGSAAGGALDPIIDVLGKLVTALSPVLGPLQMLGQALQSNISGFQMIDQATKVLATTIGPIFLPIMTLFSAYILAVSEVVAERLLPMMDEWFGLVMEQGVPALTILISVITFAADAVMVFVQAYMQAVAWIQRQLNRLNPFAAAPDAMGDSGGKVKRGINDTIESLKRSMGPKAQISGLGSVAQQVQMAALSQDPLQARQFQVQVDMLAKLEQIAQNTTAGGAAPGRAYDPSASGASAVARRAAKMGAFGLGGLLADML
ncbi:hypothetical protein R5W24_003887 [Gemmata sp. JC717]|uniref:hypothetical protein n=1 Tax=Gemmata algarum TaxID=2975278 RepID=UPI0021BA9D23|nr:hypothetical protein [Gemmata algarum]MDY3554758.1 hypothetical protein [Gemmata algarum]